MVTPAYRDRLAGRYPVSLDEIRRNSSCLFGDEPPLEVLEAAGVDPVEAVEAPTYDPATHALTESEPEQDGDGWRQTWIVSPLPPPSDAEVTIERDRRIDAGIVFQGVAYQTRPADRENIAGAGTLAGFAVGRGAQPGDYRWHGGASDFGWIALDNSVTPMDAPTVFAFAQAAANRQAAHIFAARGIKGLNPVPRDFRADRYWPA